MKNVWKLFFAVLLFTLGMNSFAKEAKGKSYYVNQYQNPSRLDYNIRLLAENDSEIREAIEKKYIDVNFKYDEGRTLLFRLTIKYLSNPEPFIKLADFLIKNGADLNIPDDEGYTPFLFAVEHIRDANPKIIEFLLDNGADVKVQNDDHETVLYFLCNTDKPNLDLIRKVIKKGAPLNIPGYSFTPLTAALYHEQVELARLLVENGADVNLKDSDNRYPLNLACKAGNYNLVEFMISKGAKVNGSGKEGYTPLHNAVESGSKDSLEIVKLLVQKGANVNASTEAGWTPLILAGWEDVNGFEIIKFLVSKKANINAKTKKGDNVGMTCARLLNPDIYKFLGDNGFDFNARDEDGLTTLHRFVDTITCSSSDYSLNYIGVFDKKNEICQIIDYLATKTNINSSSKYNKQTALHYACYSVFDDTTVIEALIKNGANVNALNASGCTPIFLCRWKPKMVRVLVDAGTNLSVKNEDGKTCLDLCEEGIKYDAKILESIEIIKANMSGTKKYSFVQLVEYNYADKALEMLKKGNVKGLDEYDEKGFTPLYHAVVNKNQELVKELLDKGCDINKRQKNSDATVLRYAVEKLDLEMVKLLLKYKPDLTMKYKGKYWDSEANILMLCVSQDHSYDVVKVLLEAGADPNCAIENSNPGLTIAADSCSGSADYDVVELIVEYGGNPFAKWGYSRSDFSWDSIVTKNSGWDYWERRNAVYRGLVKQFKNKTLTASDNLRLRTEASLSARTITAMQKGTKVKVLEADNMEVIDGIHSCWVKVEVLPGSVDSQGKKIPNGTTGWCFLGYLE
ncbi:MAG: ankyrin repeat domain-containing protein [Treponema sp.]|nr:ankyrin repeat domain-containing protein [Treponema sp.]